MRTVICYAALVIALIAGPSTSAYASLAATGYAKYTEFSEDLFVTSLFTEKAQNSQEQLTLSDTPKRLEFKFIKDLSHKRFLRIIKQNAAINNSAEAYVRNTEGLLAFADTFKGHFHSGDHLIIHCDPSEGVITLLNRVEISRSDSTELFEIILNAWIGPVPPSREFKYELTGIQPTPEPQEIFVSLNFSESRQLEIQQWLEVENLEVTEDNPSSTAITQSTDNANKQSQVAKHVEVVVTPEGATFAKHIPASAVTASSKKNKAELERIARLAEEKLRAKKLAEDIARKQQQEIAMEFQKGFATTLIKHARANIKYPKRAQKLKHTGNVVAIVTIDRKGKVIGLEFENQAEFDSLNKAVEKGIKKSAPFPKIPADIAGEDFTFYVPVGFAIQS